MFPSLYFPITRCNLYIQSVSLTSAFIIIGLFAVDLKSVVWEHLAPELNATEITCVVIIQPSSLRLARCVWLCFPLVSILNDTLTGMDEGINLRPCRYGPQVYNSDLHVTGRRLINSIKTQKVKSWSNFTKHGLWRQTNKECTLTAFNVSQRTLADCGSFCK